MSSEVLPATEAIPLGVSGVWRRLGALTIDGLVLGAIGLALGLVFYRELIELGQLGRLVGLAIAVPYFSLLNSRIGSGQTVGKRVLGIRVVGATGEPVGPGPAMLRTSVLVLPWALNGLYIPADGSMWIQSGLSFAVFGVGGSIIYLLIANRQSRQCLHDLVAHTWVVPVDAHGAPPGSVPRVHAIVVATLLAASLLLPPIAVTWVAQSPMIADLVPIQTSLQQALGTSRVSVNRGTSAFTSTSGSETSDFLAVSVTLSHEMDDFEPTALRVASIVLEMDDHVSTYDRIVINVSYGFNILIASTNVTRSFSHSAGEWRELVPDSY